MWRSNLYNFQVEMLAFKPRHLTPVLICHHCLPQTNLPTLARGTVNKRSWFCELACWEPSMAPPLPSGSSLNSRPFRIWTLLPSCHSPSQIQNCSHLAPLQTKPFSSSPWGLYVDYNPKPSSPFSARWLMPAPASRLGLSLTSSRQPFLTPQAELGSQIDA